MSDALNEAVSRRGVRVSDATILPVFTLDARTPEQKKAARMMRDAASERAVREGRRP